MNNFEWLDCFSLPLSLPLSFSFCLHKSSEDCEISDFSDSNVQSTEHGAYEDNELGVSDDSLSGSTVACRRFPAGESNL